MKSFIIFVIVVEALAAILRVYYLAKDDYPRIDTMTSTNDVITLLAGIAIFSWGLSLVW